jgi:hypothetical protein
MTSRGADDESFLSQKSSKKAFWLIPEIMKNITDIVFSQFAFNLKNGSKLLGALPVYVEGAPGYKNTANGLD